jgi:protein TonB
MERQPLRSHLTGTVPISIAVHVVILLIVVIVPLTAVDVTLLVPFESLPGYICTLSIPLPPDAIRPVARTATARPTNVALAPTSAPQAIAPESDLRPTGSDVDIPGPVGAVTSDPTAFGGVGQSIAVRPPDPPRLAGPVRATDLPIAPRKTVDLRPVYPEIARTARVEGVVVLEAVLDPTGSVTQLRVVKSVPLLDQAALEAVRHWKYTPSVYAGRPVSVLMTITITFMLHE